MGGPSNVIMGGQISRKHCLGGGRKRAGWHHSGARGLLHLLPLHTPCTFPAVLLTLTSTAGRAEHQLYHPLQEQQVHCCGGEDVIFFSSATEKWCLNSGKEKEVTAPPPLQQTCSTVPLLFATAQQLCLHGDTILSDDETKSQIAEVPKTAAVWLHTCPLHI